ncbi:hypothetical protein CAEBREN_30147 [Caenorhabditis brenneri]|uniref:Uncharacterized protein n=1 Tax=Caenorhabditis brenneri TaxID=135651 RepID=G0NEM6_CAEBE|nr:hypothetical protein CAEBREN_30147 [Caenorhabditis brenneri]
MQTRSTDETDLTRIVDKNPHWQYLKQFHASSQIDDLKLDTIAHMDTVRISTTSEYSAQELLDYKIRILENPNFDQHVIFWQKPDCLEKYRNALSPYTPSPIDGYDEDSVSGSLPFPDRNDYRLVFKIGDWISFQKEWCGHDS